MDILIIKKTLLLWECHFHNLLCEEMIFPLHFICFVENLRTSLRKIYGHFPPGINGYPFILMGMMFS